jgi:hypothetical protein
MSLYREDTDSPKKLQAVCGKQNLLQVQKESNGLSYPFSPWLLSCVSQAVTLKMQAAGTAKGRAHCTCLVVLLVHQVTQGRWCWECTRSIGGIKTMKLVSHSMATVLVRTKYTCMYELKDTAALNNLLFACQTSIAQW